MIVSNQIPLDARQILLHAARAFRIGTKAETVHH